jgi:hypothetical protein
MHAERLDWFSKHLGGGTPRRTLLGSLLGTFAVGGMQPPVSAKKKRKKKKCKAPRIKCGKKCLAAGACCTNAECAAVIGQVCVANTCECPGGQVVADNECAQPCNPACGECQRCDDGACIDLAEGAPCSNGGSCDAGVCQPDRSFGCATTQNACVATSGVACPDSTTTDAKCFVDGAGDSVCGTGLCTSVTTDEACVAALGEGAFVVTCPLCGITGNARVCVKPVDQ